MKQIKILTFISILLISHSISLSQPQMPDYRSGKMDAMNQLSFMRGTWEGEGWVMMPGGQREEFKQRENIEEKLDGLLLLIEGVGTDKVSGEVTHNAVAMISYDLMTKKYMFDSHLIDGRSTRAEGYLEDNKFVWGFTAPNNAMIKYEIEFNESKQWVEKGYFSMDGQNWSHFFEMKLSKRE